MTSPLPVNYRTSPTIVASFPYSEIIDGTGTVAFSGSRTSIDNTPANDEHFLTTDAILPSEGETVVAAGTDLDFDVQFSGSNRVISGAAFIVMPWLLNTGVAKTCTPNVTIIHYDGSTETVLVASTNAPPISVSSITYTDRTLKVTIPRTTFKRGEILRITIGQAGDATMSLAHDPLGGNPLWVDSGGKLQAFIPFEEDLS